jgi:hypothetical protein
MRGGEETRRGETSRGEETWKERERALREDKRRYLVPEECAGEIQHNSALVIFDF